jgi:transposase InsO family protein
LEDHVSDAYQVAVDFVEDILHEYGRRAIDPLLALAADDRVRALLCRAAAIIAATTGLSTDAARDREPVRVLSLQPSTRPSRRRGQLLHRQPRGRRQGVPTHRHRRRHPRAIILIVLGTPTAGRTIRFVAHVVRCWRRLGVDVRAVLSDNGPEWTASGFGAHLTARGLEHHRIPPRSPNHNAVGERFHGTVLQACWRPAFRRRRFTSIRQLQAEADAWLTRYYHHPRRNHSHYMRGRTPADLLDTSRPRQHHEREPQGPPPVTSTPGPDGRACCEDIPGRSPRLGWTARRSVAHRRLDVSTEPIAMG